MRYRGNKLIEGWFQLNKKIDAKYKIKVEIHELLLGIKAYELYYDTVVELFTIN
jgi:hypothetical protein